MSENAARESDGEEYPIGEVTFRICRLMLARRVLWDEELGFAAEKLAEMIGAPLEVVSRALEVLDGEGWIRLDAARRIPALTDAGVAAILGRNRPGAPS